jgi:glycerol-3-phosphate dehydrogenase
MYPPLEQATQIGAYAGLRPAGRDANYVIEPSRTVPRLIHVAAIRSTGLSASLGIGEHVAGMLADQDAIALNRVRSLPWPAQPPPQAPWWERAAIHHRGPAASPGTR